MKQSSRQTRANTNRRKPINYPKESYTNPNLISHIKTKRFKIYLVVPIRLLLEPINIQNLKQTQELENQT